MTGNDRAPRTHRVCGQPMHKRVFGHNNRTPAYRSQPIWACDNCQVWEPRDGWTGVLPAEWDGEGWR